MSTRLPSRPLAFALLLAMLCLALLAHRCFAQTYSYTPIDTNGSNFGYVGEAISTSGEVAVKYLDYNYVDHLLLFVPDSPNSATGTVEDIPAPSGWAYSTTDDTVSINDNGVVALVAIDTQSSTTYILFWNPVTNPEGWNAATLPNSIGANTGVEINDDREFVYTDGTHVYIWYDQVKETGFSELSPPLDTGYQIMSMAIDSNGDVVAEAGGPYNSGDQMQIFWYAPSTPNGQLSDPPTQVSFGSITSAFTLLPTYPGAAPLNAGGYLAVEGQDQNFDSAFRAETLTGSNVDYYDIDAFSVQKSSISGIGVFGPAAINDNGLGVAVLYGGITGPYVLFPMNPSMPPTPPISLSQFGSIPGLFANECPVAINDFGQVVAGGALYTPVVAAEGPTVTLLAPANGARFPASDVAIHLAAFARSVKGASIASVVFQANGIPIASGIQNPATHDYVASWNPGGVAGQYKVTAVATDSAGNTGTSSTATILVGAMPMSQARVIKGALIFNHQPPYSYTQEITVTNEGSTAISGPIQILLTEMGMGFSVRNMTGQLTSLPGPGSYFTIPAAGLPSGRLAPGASVSVTAIFSDPDNRPVTYSAQAFNGIF